MEIVPGYIAWPQLEFGLYTFSWYNFSVLIAFHTLIVIAHRINEAFTVSSFAMISTGLDISKDILRQSICIYPVFSLRYVKEDHLEWIFFFYQFDQCIYYQRFSPVLRSFNILLTIFIETFHNILKY